MELIKLILSLILLQRSASPPPAAICLQGQDSALEIFTYFLKYLYSILHYGSESLKNPN